MTDLNSVHWTGSGLTDVISGFSVYADCDRPYIFTAGLASYLLAPACFQPSAEIALTQCRSIWNESSVEQLFGEAPVADLQVIVERFGTPLYYDTQDIDQWWLYDQLLVLLRTEQIRVYDLSWLLPAPACAGLSQERVLHLGRDDVGRTGAALAGAAAAAMPVSPQHPGSRPAPRPAPRPGAGRAPIPPGGAKIIRFPDRMYGGAHGRPPASARPTRSLAGRALQTVARWSTWTLLLASSPLGGRTEWHDEHDPDVTYVHFPESMALHVYVGDELSQVLRLEPVLSETPGEDGNRLTGRYIIYESGYTPIATVGADGVVAPITDTSRAALEDIQLSQELVRELRYRMYLANGGSQSKRDWISEGEPDVELSRAASVDEEETPGVTDIPSSPRWVESEPAEGVDTSHDLQLLPHAEADELVRLKAEEYLYELEDKVERGELSRAEAGPVIAGVVDRRTGEFFAAHNNRRGRSPEDLHPLLNDRVSEVAEAPGHPSRAGSHAEVYALNDALRARGGNVQESDLEEFTLLPLWRKGSGKGKMSFGEPAPRCSNCSAITKGVRNLSGDAPPHPSMSQ